MPNIVAVQQHCGSPQLVQLTIELVSHRALATTAQTREPNDQPTLSQMTLAIVTRNGVIMPNNVGGLCHLDSNESICSHGLPGQVTRSYSLSV
jgi:hypothetical protein